MAIFVAIALVAIIAAIGFALDLGRMYVAKAELQKLATVAALSTVRQVSGCSTGVNEPVSEDDLGSFVNSQFLLNGLLEEQIESLTTAIFPGVQTADGVRSVLDTNIDSGMADSVGVSISRPLPPALFPLSPRPEGALLRAEAHAAQTVVGRVSVSPQLLAVNTDESALLSGLLGGLLGTAVNLTVADFNSLIDANVTLLDIVRTNPVVASVDDFLNLETSLSGALDLVGNALFDTGEAVEIAAANLLGGLAADAAPPRSSVRIGDFIGVEEGFEDQVGNLPINAFDLLMGLSQLANVGYQVAFAVPNLVGLNIPGVASLNINTAVRLGQAPQEAFGRPGYNSDGLPNTRAYSSQVEVLLSINLNLLAGLTAVNLELGLEAASATADLAAIRCATPANPQTTVWVDGNASVARLVVGDIDINDPDPLDNAGPLQLVSLLGIGSIGLNPPINVPVGNSSEGFLRFDGPFVPDIETPAPQHTQSITVDTGDLLASAVSTLAFQVADNLDIQLLGLEFLLGPLINPVLTLVATLLEPILTTVGVAVLEPLLDALGVSVGGAEITVKSATVSQPFLYHVE